MMTILAGIKTGSVVIAYGALLCIGFRIGRVFTDRFDEKMMEYDRKLINRLAEEHKAL